jgi:hypothetical protein
MRRQPKHVRSDNKNGLVSPTYACRHNTPACNDVEASGPDLLYFQRTIICTLKRPIAL